MTSVTVAGLDLSYTGTVGVVLDLAGSLVAKTGVSTGPKGWSCRAARLVYIRNTVLQFVDRYQPKVIAIEGYAYGAKNGREEAGELGGQVRVALWENGFTYGDVSPTALKAFATGKGQCEKNLVLREVFKKWGYEAKDDNDADAYTLAQLARLLVDPTSITKDQRIALGKVELVRADCMANA